MLCQVSLTSVSQGHGHLKYSNFDLGIACYFLQEESKGRILLQKESGEGGG